MFVQETFGMVDLFTRAINERPNEIYQGEGIRLSQEPQVTHYDRQGNATMNKTESSGKSFFILG